MFLQSLTNLFELFECLRELLFHLTDVHRSTNTSNYILTLCIGQELTEQTFCSGSRVTGKRNTSTAIISHVSECHGLYIDCSTPGIRNIIVTTIYICSRVVPGTEDCFDRTHQLLLRIIREVSTNLLFIFSFELISQFFQIISIKLNIKLHTFFLFHLVNELFKILFAHFHNDIRIHLDKSTIAVPCPTSISGFLRQNIYNGLIKTKI